jgi:hypothetical protein
MPFAWDPEKAAENLRKHGVPFEEAETVFDDPCQRHSSTRIILKGKSAISKLAMLAVGGCSWCAIPNGRAITHHERASCHTQGEAER